MSASGSVRKNDGESSKTDWQTPGWLFDWADDLFGFTVDGAASAENAKLERFFVGPCVAGAAPCPDCGCRIKVAVSYLLAGVDAGTSFKTMLTRLTAPSPSSYEEPHGFVMACRRCEGIPPDPLPVCACGLCTPWKGERVWLNPPYGGGLDLWVEKCIIETGYRGTSLALLPNPSDAVWYRTAVDQCLEYLNFTGRVPFIDPATGKAAPGNTTGSTLFRFDWPKLADGPGRVGWMSLSDIRPKRGKKAVIAASLKVGPAEWMVGDGGG